MARKICRPEKIVSKLRQVDVLHSQGMPNLHLPPNKRGSIAETRTPNRANAPARPPFRRSVQADVTGARPGTNRTLG